MKSRMILLTVEDIRLHESGGFVTVYVEGDIGYFMCTTGLNAFVVIREGENKTILLRARELKNGDKIWIDFNQLYLQELKTEC